MKVKKAVILVAGAGTRFLPFTKAMPKEMLPIIDTPILQYVVEDVIASGIEDIIFVTGRGKTAIENHFDHSFELEHLLEKKNDHEKLEKVAEIAEMVDVHYVRQKKLSAGMPDATYYARKHVGDEPFVVISGDEIIRTANGEPFLKTVIKTASKYDSSCVGVMKVPKEEIYKYGCIGGKEVEKGVYKVNELVEKPPVEKAPSNLAAMSPYVFTPEYFEATEKTPAGKGGEKWWPDVAKILMKEYGQDFYAKELDGKWYDCGSKIGFLKTTIEFAMQREDTKQELKAYLKSLKL